MKAIKILGLILVLIIAFVGVSIYFTLNNINQIVKQVVEEAGSETLKTKVSLSEVDVRLAESRARLAGLTIQNVPGFSAKNLFEMDEIIVDLNLQAILDKRIDLTEVTVNGIRIVAEQKGATTNVQKLMDQLPKAEKSTSQPPKESSESSAPEVTVRIDKFLFANSAVTLITEKWGEQSLAVPSIALSNVGGKNGVPPDQLAAAIVQPLLKQVNAAVKEGIQDAAEAKAKEKLRDKLRENLGDNADEAESAVKSLLGR